MKLLTKKLLKRFAEVGDQCERGNDPIIIAHYFYFGGPPEFFCISFDPETQEFYAYRQVWCTYDADEWNLVDLDEMGYGKDKYGFHIRRDPYWVEKRASQVIDGFKGF
jgi:hypothetical protein